MATIVNTPPPSGPADNTSSALGTLVGLLTLLILGVLFFVYGLPALRSATGSPAVNVPGKIDVNLNGPNSGSSGQNSGSNPGSNTGGGTGGNTGGGAQPSGQ
jgi:hypothetical protein